MADKAGFSDGKFAKREHLLKTGEFRFVYRKGRSVKLGPFVLCYLPGQSAFSRIGFSISSRAIARATARNRVRRLFREAYRMNKALVASPHDMVLVVKAAPKEPMDLERTVATLKKLYRLAGLSQ